MTNYGFDFEEGGYRFESVETPGVKGESTITISKDGEVIKVFQFPSYKIWNIPAHAKDIVADIEEGLKIAGSTGLGGNVYQG